MADAIAFFITIATYGTWLPGDQRGWVEYHKGWKMPNRSLELEASATMAEEAKILCPHQRQLVEQQVKDTCSHRGWTCHAVNCRTNHMHTVVTAPNTSGKKVRSDIKAWCTRKLKEDTLANPSQHWWAKRGSIRWVLDEDGLNQVIQYTLDQDEKH